MDHIIFMCIKQNNLFIFEIDDSGDMYIIYIYINLITILKIIIISIQFHYHFHLVQLFPHLSLLDYFHLRRLMLNVS